MTPTIEMVREFHLAFGLKDHTAQEPMTLPTPLVLLSRSQCLIEEVGELAHALAKEDLVETLDALTDIQYFLDGTFIACGIPKNHHQPLKSNGETPRVMDPDNGMKNINSLLSHLCGVVDSFTSGNLEYVQVALRRFNKMLEIAYRDCGMIDVKQAAFEEVHRTNMAKLGPDGKPIRDASGRVVKPKGWQSPDLVSILNGAN